MPLYLAEPVIKIHCPDFDLAQTLDCGQCFRWEMLEDGSFSGIAFGKYCRVSKRAKLYPFLTSHQRTSIPCGGPTSTWIVTMAL
ncbi:MAG: DNA glycosylase [Candidatus Pararuminococcus gallinarum]